MPRRRLFRIGATIWIAIGLGHALLVDLLTLALHTSVARFVPTDEVLGALESTTLDFGLMGANIAYRTVAGFSLWLALSLVFLGVIYRLLAAQPAVQLRPFVALGVAISLVFLALSVICFIFPPMIASAAAVAVFAGSWLRAET